MTDEGKAGIVGFLFLGITVVSGLIGDTFGFVVFLLLTALLVSSVIAVDRKENAGKKEREIINRKFKEELEELRREGVDT